MPDDLAAVSLKEYFNTRLSDLDERLGERAASQRTAVDTAMQASEKAVNVALLAAKEAVAAALASQEKAVAAALAAQEKAVTKAEAAQQKVNEGQNEWRGAQKDIVATMMPRSESELQLNELRGLVQELRETVAAFGPFPVQLSKHEAQLASLESRSNTTAGSTTGRSSQTSMLIALAALGLTVAGFIFTVMSG